MELVIMKDLEYRSKILNNGCRDNISFIRLEVMLQRVDNIGVREQRRYPAGDGPIDSQHSPKPDGVNALITLSSVRIYSCNGLAVAQEVDMERLKPLSGIKRGDEHNAAALACRKVSRMCRSLSYSPLSKRPILLTPDQNHVMPSSFCSSAHKASCEVRLPIHRHSSEPAE